MPTPQKPRLNQSIGKSETGNEERRSGSSARNIALSAACPARASPTMPPSSEKSSFSYDELAILCEDVRALKQEAIDFRKQASEIEQLRSQLDRMKSQMEYMWTRRSESGQEDIAAGSRTLRLLGSTEIPTHSTPDEFVVGTRSIQRKDVINHSTAFEVMSSTSTEVPRREKRLCGSVWDALVFVRMGAMCCSDDLVMLVLAFVNFTIQSIFISIVQTNFVTCEFSTRDIVQQMQDWRVTYSHDPRYADEVSSTPLAKLICTRNPFIMEGAQMAIRFQQLDDYLRLLVGFHSGPLLCILAITLWMFICIREGKRCSEFLFAVWLRVYDSGDFDLEGLHRCLSASSFVFSKVSKRQSVVFSGEMTCTSLDLNISFARGVLLTVFVFVPRTFVLIRLALTGTQFLVATIELQELILNAVALEVILHIDEMVYELFVPEVVQTMLGKMLPFRLPRSPVLVTMASPWLKLGLVAGILVLVRHGGLLLDPLLKNMEDTRHVMCSGDLDFLAFKTALGPVAAGKAQGVTRMNRTSYLYRAVMQRTGLQELCFSSCLYLDSDQKATPFPIQTAAHAQHLQALSVGSIANQRPGDSTYGIECILDLAWVRSYGTAADGAIFEAIREQVNDPRASTCAYLHINDWCTAKNRGGASTRFFCPHTCGTNDPLSGNPYWDPQYGVPSDCDRLLGMTLINMPCEDANISTASSAFSTAADGYLQLLSDTLIRLSSGNATHRKALARPFEQFARYGCPWLVHWNEPDKYIRSLASGTSYNVPAILCSVAQLSSLGNWKSARFLCPITCGCTTKVVQAAPGMRFISVASSQHGKNWTTSIGVSSNCPKQCFGTSVN